MAFVQFEAGEFIAGSIAKVLSSVASGARASTGTPPRSAPLDIAIPVYRNAKAFGQCLESLLPTLSEGDRVWLVDDASEQTEIDQLFARFKDDWPGTRCLVNDFNLGFTGTCNRIFALTDRDLVLLNSDTISCAGWLEYLQACQARNPEAGIVCPISDNATILSVLPPHSGNERGPLAKAAAATSIGDVPLPTAVGFCMLIRRQLLSDIGGFCRLFSPGYGEENDFSMRALRAGWSILAADRSVVLHDSGSGSFNDERARKIRRKHQAALDRIWPEYGPLVQAWWRENPFRGKIERLARRDDSKGGVLHLLHRQSLIGGTEHVARTLVEALAPGFPQILAYPGLTEDAWCDFETQADGKFRETMLNLRWVRPRTWVSGHGADLHCLHSERALAQLIDGFRPSVVHFHHLLYWDSLLLPALARSLGCRVVISIHDFWFNCPQYNQIEFSSGRPCGRKCATADRRCLDCLTGHAGELSEPSVYLPARRELIRNMLETADALIVPSRFIQQKLADAYTGIAPNRVHLVPHGVKRPAGPAKPSPEPGYVVAYLGGDLVLKGASVVIEMARILKDAPLTFRVFGRIKGFDSEQLPANVELRGFYQPDRVGEALEGVDLVLIPSFFEESFSLVASECWAHGVPVLSSSYGALGERVKPGFNGWLVADMRPETWATTLRSIIGHGDLEACLKNREDWEVTNIRQSAQAVEDIYRNLMDRPALPAEKATGARALRRFTSKLESLRSGGARSVSGRLSRRCLGIVRDGWAPANYRVRFPLEDLVRAETNFDCSFHVVCDSGMDIVRMLASHGPGSVLTQPFLSDSGMRLFEALHRESGMHVALVIDDLWTALPDDNPVSRMIPADVEKRLRYAAMLSDTLVFTTKRLREFLSFGHDNTHVIPNALPEWIWDSLRPRSRARGEKLRIGWAGATQHGGDLAFLVEVVEATSEKVDWVFLGMGPEPLRERVRSVQPMVPFSDYPATLAGLGLDMAIAPLAVNDFNRCKSQLKLLEYGALGIPVVAADLEPYRGSPAPLARPDDAGDWIEKIRELVDNEEKRRWIGDNLHRWVKTNHMCRHRRKEWMNAMGLNDEAR